MSKLELDELTELKKITKSYEDKLKLLGIDLDNLPEDCLRKLDEYAKIKQETNLIDLDSSYLQQYFLEKELDNITNLEVINKLNVDIQELQEDIDKENEEITFLQKGCEEFNASILSFGEKTKIENECEKQQQDFMKKINEFVEDADAEKTLEQLMAKVELIKIKKENK